MTLYLMLDPAAVVVVVGTVVVVLGGWLVYRRTRPRRKSDLDLLDESLRWIIRKGGST